MDSTLFQSAQKTSTSAGTASPHNDLRQNIATPFFAQAQQKNDGPRFESPVSAAFFPMPEGAQSLFAVLEAAKNNGWGMRLAKAIRGNLKPLAGIGTSLVLALIAITVLRSYIPETRLATIKNVAPLAESQSADNVALPIGLELADNANANPGTTLGPNTIKTEKALTGEGITHLARRAVQERLNDLHKTLSPAQLVFAEDFAQKALGSHTLYPGERLSFAYTLLDEAIAGAENLSSEQISNLAQWSNQVAEFNL